MYQLSDFTPYDGNIRDGLHKVLVWDKKQGYYFISFGFVLPNSGVKIIAREK